MIWQIGLESREGPEIRMCLFDEMKSPSGQILVYIIWTRAKNEAALDFEFFVLNRHGKEFDLNTNESLWAYN